MEPFAQPSRNGGAEPVTIRVAACGDVHCRAERPNATVEALAALDGTADLLLLAGDLTTLGLPEEAATLAEGLAGLELPVVCVLGNHDLHSDRTDEVVAALEAGGICVLDRSSTVLEVRGLEVGIAGTKGFVGGFAGCHLPDFGEPSLRDVYAETGAEVEALDAALREIAVCPLRLALLHYAPISETLEGERESIWTFLGTDRLAAPIAEHQPHLVVHGHAHAGTFAGKVGEVEVFNVSVPVLGRDYWLFELEASQAPSHAIH
jgi:Icc-related predicted phosphoesterase